MSVATRDEVEPLSPERSRIHVNVSRQFTRKLEAARMGLGHSIPNATIEQALEVALDLLLEKQAKARGQVKRPPSIAPTPTASATAKEQQTPSDSLPSISNSSSASAPPILAPTTREPFHRRTGPRETIPAAVRRAVWDRDDGRCTWPLDGGGRCGSTQRLELDHVVPWGKDGRPTEANLRLLCHCHNALAAQQEFGARLMKRYAGST